MKLLLLSCSAKKNPAPGQLPAFERYIGVVYQVIRKARREGYWPEDCQLAIVSACYGLLSETTRIEAYDQKMTRARAQAMQRQVSVSLDTCLATNQYDHAFIIMGSHYRSTIQASVELERLSRSGSVLTASGGLGTQLQQLREWLIYAHQARSMCAPDSPDTRPAWRPL